VTTERLAEPRAARRGGVRALSSGNVGAVIERAFLATRTSNWWIILTGFFEPVFYLLSLGLGVGGFIGSVVDGAGREISYAAFVAPALLAVSAMNGAMYESTWNVFFKMQYAKLYQGMLATSLGPLDVALGEIIWGLLRGALYAIGFQLVMQALGLNLAWTALLAVPAVVLIGFGFSSLGMGVTSYMKTFQQMDWIAFFMMPLFLLSATFYPITVYPEWAQWIIMCLPLWHGVELIRGLTTGALDWTMLIHVGYYLAMIAFGLVFTTRRLRALFLK